VPKDSAGLRMGTRGVVTIWVTIPLRSVRARRRRKR
jgi:hypothetical protein